MILDDIRARYPALGLAVFAMEPGKPVTLETYAPDGAVFSFTAATVAGAIEKAFPEMTIGETEGQSQPTEADPGEPEASVFD